ncbi:MAG: glycerol-3-phosphate dehydrogenase [Rhizobiales bacterium PAR1]|nr:MAG: glycerol-3-phosphate dehydrogenase [Rhizobiales bacterium PAR1]
MKNNQVAVIGAGAFGCALALAFARAGRAVLLWGRDSTRMAEMATTRLCGEALPGMALEAGILPTSDLGTACKPGVIVAAIPTQNLHEVAKTMRGLISPNAAIISAAKGIERSSGAFVTDILAQALGSHRFGVISGPSFAMDIARKLPTAISLAMPDSADAEALAHYLSSPGLRLYHTSDVRGVEIGGAAKNVLAIAAGIIAGMGLGESARAAMVARGFAELRRYADAFGARAETLMGLSGLGDLVLTASSTQSRNYSLGLALGAGKSLAEANPTGKLAEGAFTAAILAKSARDQGVEMPIVEAVAAVLDETMSVREAVMGLMARPLKGE